MCAVVYVCVLTAAEEAQDVATFLVPRIRAVPQQSVNPITSSINTNYIQYLTKQKAYSQIFSVSPYKMVPVSADLR